MIGKAGSGRVRRFARIGRAAGGLVTLASAGVLLGWALGIGSPGGLVPGSPAMVPNTALGFFLAGLALWLMPAAEPAAAGTQAERVPGRGLAVALGAAISLLGVVTLGEYVSGADLGLDRLLFRSVGAEAPPGPYPGRPSPQTAVVLLLGGIATAARARGVLIRGWWWEALLLAAAFVPALALAGYAYGFAALHSVAPGTGMALHTALLALVLCAGLLLSRPDGHFMRLLGAEGPGGADTRRLGLALGAGLGATLLVHLAGWALGLGASLLGESLIVLSVIVVSAVLVLHARSEERHDAERRRTEAQLRLQASALDAAANAILIADRSGTIVSVNPAFTRLTGYGADEAEGRNPRLLKSGRQDPVFYRELWETITAGRVWRGELTNRRKDGSEYIEEQTITPVTDEAGSITHFVAIKQDVTETRRLEREVREKRKAEAVGAVAAGVAHNFNNLLTGIMGFASLAQSRLDAGHPVRPNLDRIVTASERAARIARQLLAYAGKATLDMKVQNLADLVRAEAEVVGRALPAGVEIVLELADGLPAVRADALQVREAVASVLANAVEAIQEAQAREAGRPHRITVSAALEKVEPRDEGDGHVPQAVHAPGEYVRVSVEDTGTGMDRDTLPRIFDPFFTTKFMGRGLGLAAVLGTVLAHRGGLRVSSEPGRGTTVTLLLPVTR